jgi:hypothetical protein
MRTMAPSNGPTPVPSRYSSRCRGRCNDLGAWPRPGACGTPRPRRAPSRRPCWRARRRRRRAIALSASLPGCACPPPAPPDCPTSPSRRAAPARAALAASAANLQPSPLFCPSLGGLSIRRERMQRNMRLRQFYCCLTTGGPGVYGGCSADAERNPPSVCWMGRSKLADGTVLFRPKRSVQKSRFMHGQSAAYAPKPSSTPLSLLAPPEFVAGAFWFPSRLGLSPVRSGISRRSPRPA